MPIIIRVSGVQLIFVRLSDNFLLSLYFMIDVDKFNTLSKSKYSKIDISNKSVNNKCSVSSTVPDRFWDSCDDQNEV